MKHKNTILAALLMSTLSMGAFEASARPAPTPENIIINEVLAVDAKRAAGQVECWVANWGDGTLQCPKTDSNRDSKTAASIGVDDCIMTGGCHIKCRQDGKEIHDNFDYEPMLAKDCFKQMREAEASHNGKF